MAMERQQFSSLESTVNDMNGSKESDKYGTTEIHQYLCGMMDDIDAFCKKKRILYSLSGGTFLGAVRHKGFIPWDDDMDIMFDRKNYRRFLKAVNSGELPGYKIVGKTWVKRVTRRDNPNAAKEEDCIDLFVFDNVPSDPIIAKIKLLILKMLQGMMKDKPDYERFSLKYKILIFVTSTMGKLFPQKFKQDAYDMVSCIGNGDKSSDKINIYNTYFKQIGTLKFESSILKKYRYADFGGRRFMVLKDHDGYLRELYGDYMKLPPENDRKPLHRK